MSHGRSIGRAVGAFMAAAMLLGVVPALPAQTRSAVPVVAAEVAASVERSRTLRLPLAASHVALHWLGAEHATISVAFSRDGRTFSEPVIVEHDEAGGHDPSGETYGAVMLAHGARFARVTSDQRLARVSVVAMDSRRATAPLSGSVASAAVEQPAVISRSGWGADESLRYDSAGNEIWPPQFYPVQKLIVHHTAGTNDDPDPPATVRAIYYYHAVTRGWGDIGYNFLVDESGRVYEGRYSRPYAAGEVPTGEDQSGNGVTGAHVGGWNSGTVGIALLGTLTDQDATPAARSALESMLAWKADRHAIDPRGNDLYTNPVNGSEKTVANISGHRDWAATECPGGVFYSTLPSLREAVAARVGGTTPATVPGAPVLSAATASSGRGIDLSWTVPPDGGSPITAYEIHRKKGRSYTRIATVSGSTTTYRDASVRRGRTFSYRVRAVNAIGVGPLSNEATATAR